MKQRYFSTLQGILSVACAVTIIFAATGCSKSSDDSTSATGTDKSANPGLAKATPPPDFNPSGQIAAQSAAAKGAEEAKRQIEAGKK